MKWKKEQVKDDGEELSPDDTKNFLSGCEKENILLMGQVGGKDREVVDMENGKCGERRIRENNKMKDGSGDDDDDEEMCRENGSSEDSSRKDVVTIISTKSDDM